MSRTMRSDNQQTIPTNTVYTASGSVAVTTPSPDGTLAWTWYSEGDKVFDAMLEAVAAARLSVRLETYIFEAAGIGGRMRDGLAAAAQRGVRVIVLVDALGSDALPASFWKPLLKAGGEIRVFNPTRLNRLGIRDHRKLLVCDDEVAFVGGYNIAPNYEGDGVKQGWLDVALRITGRLAAALGETFDRMYAGASFRRKLFTRLRRAREKLAVDTCGCEIILSGPGRGGSPLLRAIQRDLSSASSVQIMVAYFLPTRRLWRSLRRAARHGTAVELVLPGKSDVPIAKLAAESLYGRMVRAGLRVFEYQPQVLHGKLFVIDDAVYVGSSNLDPRSLRVNYELMLRLEGREVAAAARALFNNCRKNCREIQTGPLLHNVSLWTLMKQRFAHFVMARLDPWFALTQWRGMPD